MSHSITANSVKISSTNVLSQKEKYIYNRLIGLFLERTQTTDSSVSVTRRWCDILLLADKTKELVWTNRYNSRGSEERTEPKPTNASVTAREERPWKIDVVYREKTNKQTAKGTGWEVRGGSQMSEYSSTLNGSQWNTFKVDLSDQPELQTQQNKHLTVYLRSDSTCLSLTALTTLWMVLFVISSSLVLGRLVKWVSASQIRQDSWNQSVLKGWNTCCLHERRDSSGLLPNVALK